jgi:hypothetical protein
MMYMRRESQAILDLREELQGITFAPHHITESGCDVWGGVVFIRTQASPWYKGAFPFTVEFPPKYPMECPVAVFDHPLRSHPLLVEGTKIPFEWEYISLDAMQVSLMVRLLKFIRRLFVVEEWPGLVPSTLVEPVPKPDLRKAQADVSKCSVTEEAVLTHPFVQFLTTEAKEWFLRHDDAGSHHNISDDNFPQFFTSRVVPTARGATCK